MNRHAEPRPHPDDQSTIDALIDQFGRVRRAAGLTQREVGNRVGLDNASVSMFESRARSHRLTVTQQYFRAVGHRLVLTVEGLATPPEDVESVMLDHLSDQGDPALADKIDRLRLLNLLTRIRLYRGLSQAEVGRRAGRLHCWANRLEAGEKDQQIASYLAYTRALGGRLTVVAEPRITTSEPTRKAA